MLRKVSLGLFSSVAHEIVRPNQIGWRHQVTHAYGGKRCVYKYVIWKWKVYLCYALLPWAFDLLRNQFDWGAQFRAPRNNFFPDSLFTCVCDNACVKISLGTR